jgi:hypothetical protein
MDDGGWFINFNTGRVCQYNVVDMESTITSELDKVIAKQLLAHDAVHFDTGGSASIMSSLFEICLANGYWAAPLGNTVIIKKLDE